jgi:hypothetical protein
MLKNSFSSLAAALETAATPPSIFPRYVVTAKDGAQYLLGPDRRPMFYRPGRGHPGERVDAAARVRHAVSERDLWSGGASPLHDRVSGWEVSNELRLWRLLEE